MYPRESGWLEVVCGSMFSGKTEELIRRLRRACIGRQVVQCFKHSTDNRYSSERIVSHDHREVLAEPVRSASEITKLIKPRTRVVGIDEVQFFDDDIIELCERLDYEGRRVIVAGLDQDYRGRPFGSLPILMALAEFVTKTQAICVVCGNPASKSQRVKGGDEVVQVGASDSYEPRCRHCFEPEGVEGRQQWKLPGIDPPSEVASAKGLSHTSSSVELAQRNQEAS